MKLKLTLALFSVILFAGCTTQKSLAYLNSVDEQAADSLNKKFTAVNVSKIQTGDQLTIVVSGADPEAVVPFNSPVVAYSSPNSSTLYGQPTLLPYLVDENGDINFPRIGKIKIGGLTKIEAIKLITGDLEPYIKDPVVTMNFVNFKISVIGEVAHPGQYPINSERINIFEALALAGDMTIYGKRDNVLITREVDGKLEFARLDLNSPSVFESPFYYLKQNDIVSVEPNSAKTISSQNIPLYISATSTLLTLMTLIYTISKK